MTIENDIRTAMEDAMAEVTQAVWRESRPGIWHCDDYPNATIFRLRLGGYRYHLGQYESATYGQRDACEAALAKDALVRTHMGVQL